MISHSANCYTQQNEDVFSCHGKKRWRSSIVGLIDKLSKRHFFDKFLASTSLPTITIFEIQPAVTLEQSKMITLWYSGSSLQLVVSLLAGTCVTRMGCMWIPMYPARTAEGTALVSDSHTQYNNHFIQEY